MSKRSVTTSVEQNNIALRAESAATKTGEAVAIAVHTTAKVTVGVSKGFLAGFKAGWAKS